MAQENKPTMYQSVMNTLGLGEKHPDQTNTPGVGTQTTGLDSQTQGLGTQTTDYSQTQGLGNQTADYTPGYSAQSATQNISTPGFSQSTPLDTTTSTPVTTGSLQSDNAGRSAFGSNDIYAQGDNRLGEPAQPLSAAGQQMKSASYSSSSSSDDEPEELKNPAGGYTATGIGGTGVDDGTGVPHKESAKDKIKHVADKVKEKIGMHHK